MLAPLRNSLFITACFQGNPLGHSTSQGPVLYIFQNLSKSHLGPYFDLSVASIVLAVVNAYWETFAPYE